MRAVCIASSACLRLKRKAAFIPSTATVAVLPEAQDVDVEFKPEDFGLKFGARAVPEGRA